MKTDLSLKSRLLNFFRKIFFLNRFSEKILLRKTLKYGNYSFWNKFILPYYLYPRGTMRAVVRHGIKYNLDLSNLIEYVIFWYGYIDKNQKALFDATEENMTVIDVGANIGGTLLEFAKKAVGGRVIGFEPDPINYKKLIENISLNDFKNIETIRCGLGDREATMNLYSVESNNPGANKILNKNADIPHENIHVIRFDDFAAKNNLKNVDIIKIDIEGFEMNMLKGAEQTLKKFKPLLFIEVDEENLKEHGYSASVLIEYLYKFGYKVYNADDGRLLNPDNDYTACHFDIICK